MNIMSFMKFPWPLKTKASVAVAQMLNIGQWAIGFSGWRSFAKEGYQGNSTVYACVRYIAENAARIDPKVRDKNTGGVIEDGALVELLSEPNVDEGGVEFRTAQYSWLMLLGNCFTEKVKISEDRWELWNYQPYEMEIGHSSRNPLIPAAYAWNKGCSNSKQWDVDPITGETAILHWRLFNPLPEKPFFGLSPLSAASSAGDQLNAANKWRYNTFKNDCRPSGILQSKAQGITSAQRKELKEDLEKVQSGSDNASQFMLLTGDLEWKQMGLSPKDSDWLEGSKYNKQEICEAYRVPTQLLGIEGSQTYANYEEARLAFWQETVIPLMSLWCSEMNRWFTPSFGDDIEICIDPNDITALEPSRQKTTEMLLNSQVLSINEKRELLGYEPIAVAEADQVLVDSNKIPLGVDVFAETEKAEKEAVKGLIELGYSKQEAQQKVIELGWSKKECHHK